MCSTEAKFPRLARGRGRGLLASDLQHAGLVIDAGWPAERAEACLCSVADAGAHEHTFGDSVNVMAFDPGFLLNGFSASNREKSPNGAQVVGLDVRAFDDARRNRANAAGIGDAMGFDRPQKRVDVELRLDHEFAPRDQRGNQHQQHSRIVNER